MMFLASTASEVKNDSVHVIMPAISNKFIKVNFCVGCMVSRHNSLFQHWTFFNYFNKISMYITHSQDFISLPKLHLESVMLRISCYSVCCSLNNNLLLDLPKVWFLVDSFLVLANFVQSVVRFDYSSQGVSIPLRPWSILARQWLPLEMGARFLPTDPKKEHIYKRSLKKLMQNQLLENVNLLDTAHL